MSGGGGQDRVNEPPSCMGRFDFSVAASPNVRGGRFPLPTRSVTLLSDPGRDAGGFKDSPNKKSRCPKVHLTAQ